MSSKDSQFSQFLLEYNELIKKYGVCIEACGVCGELYLEDAKDNQVLKLSSGGCEVTEGRSVEYE